MFPGAVKSMNRGRTKVDRSFASQRGGHTRNIAGKGSKHAPPNKTPSARMGYLIYVNAS